MSISRNTLYNLLGALIPLATALGTVPLYIEYIGENRYGVLAIAWLLLGYFGVFDLGLGRATAQRIAKLRSAPQDRRACAFWTALLLNGSFGIIGGVLIWPAANLFFSDYFKIDSVLTPEILSAIPWLVMALPMATISGVLTGALQGLEKFLVLNIVSAAGSVLFQVIPLTVAWLWTPNLAILLPVALFSRFLTLLLLFLLCKENVFGNTKITFRREEARNLLSFGGWVTVSSFISPIMVMVDRFITGAILGAKAVTYYTVPYQLAERTTILPTALSSSLFPRFAMLEPMEERQVAKNALRTLLVIMTPLSALAIVLAKPFLSVWISSDFAKESATVAMLLLAGFWVNGLARVPHAQLQARGNPDIVAKCHLAEILPYLLVLYFAIHQYGIAGAAAAFTVRLYVDFLLLSLFSGVLRNVFLLKCSAMFFIALAFFVDDFSSMSGLHWSIPASILFLVTGAWSLLNAPEQIRGALKRLRYAF